MTNTRALQAAIAEPWAITAEGLELVLAVAARETDVSLEALEAYRAKHVATAERMEARGSVAILTARGPLFPRANLFTTISGATSYDVMRRDLQAALDDPTFRAVVISFDTPGGAVTGANELAEAIFAGRAVKPIIAYVGGSAASAGYWLASQASSVVVEATAVVGSIGVRAVLTDTTQDDAKRGRHEFVSSQSPAKRTDLASDEGRGRIQRTVDALADVFVSAVARGRGVKPEAVIARFGGGDVLVGAAAVAAGMADRVGTFEGVIAELAAGKFPAPSPTKRRLSMDDNISRAEHDRLVASARTEGEATGRKAGATDERSRISAILSLPEATGREASARHLALNTDLTADVAKGVLAGVGAVAPAQAADPAPAPAPPQRSADAPGGLVLADPSKPQTSAEEKKAMWGNTIKAINGASRITA